MIEMLMSQPSLWQVALLALLIIVINCALTVLAVRIAHGRGRTERFEGSLEAVLGWLSDPYGGASEAVISRLLSRRRQNLLRGDDAERHGIH